MNGNGQGLRALAIVASLALILSAFFNFNFSWLTGKKPEPLLKLDTPEAAPSSADSSLDFIAPGLDGKPVDLSKFRGHPVIVDFWATWCGPCRKQIPELIALYNKYNKSRGLVVIGVACDTIQGDGIKAVKPFVEEFAIDYPIVIADERLVDSMGVEAIPTTLFIGPDGKLVSKVVGAGHAGELSASAKELLDGAKNHGAPTRPDELNGHVVDINYGKLLPAR